METFTTGKKLDPRVERLLQLITEARRARQALALRENKPDPHKIVPS